MSAFIRYQPIALGGGGGSTPPFVYSKSYYIDPVNGSDSTGTGSPGAPWATIAHANTVITTNDASHVFVLFLSPGTYTENVSLKSYIYLQGVIGIVDENAVSTANAVFIVGNVVIADSASGSFAMSNLSISGTTKTYTTSTTATGNFYANRVTFGTGVTIGSANVTGNVIYSVFDSCYIAGIDTSDDSYFYSAPASLNACFVRANIHCIASGVVLVDTQSNYTFALDDDTDSNTPSLQFIGTYNIPTITYAGAGSAQIVSSDPLGSGALTLTGSGAFSIICSSEQRKAVNSTLTLLGDANLILVTTGASGKVVTVPLAVNCQGMVLRIMKVDNGAGAVTIGRQGSDTFNASTSLTLATQYKSYTLVSDGSSKWLIFAST